MVPLGTDWPLARPAIDWVMERRGLIFIDDYGRVQGWKNTESLEYVHRVTLVESMPGSPSSRFVVGAPSTF